MVRELGRGGMGVVRLARDRRLGRLVSIKSIRSDAGTALTGQFRAEAETVARLEHPHIVRLYEVEADGRQTCLILEYVSGGTLAGRLARGPLVPRAAAALLADLAGAVRYAHERGVVHRDLKPANVLLDDRPADTGPAKPPAPKIADFGLAKRADRVYPRSDGKTSLAEEEATSHTGLLVGTPSYMAPEQAAGDDRAVGPAADVYALGAVLYECLTGRPPFQAATAAETLELVRSRDPVPVRQLQPVVPRDLETIVLKCLQKDPVRRYASAAELGEDLGRFQRGEPVRARPVGAVTRLMKAARRRPAAAALVGVLALAATGGAAGLVAHNARLGRALARAAAQEERAVRQEARAAANYHGARDAVQRMLRHLTDRDFTGVPRLTDLRRRQAEEALRFFEEVAAAADDPDPEMRADVARAWHEAGRLRWDLGRPEAETSFRRAAQLFAALAEEFPAEPQYRAGRATALDALGCWLARADRPESAAEQLRSALALREALVADYPESDAYRADLAASHVNIGGIHYQRGRLTEAEADYRAAVDLRTALLDKVPTREARRALAECLLNLSVVFQQRTDRAAESSDCYEQAAVQLEELVRTDPLDYSSLRSLAQLRVNWGYVLVNTGRAAEAADGLAPSLAALEDLHAREPELVTARDTLLRAHGARAQWLEQLGRFTEAVSDWERVVALETGPERPVRRIGLANALVRAGEPDRAVAEVQDVAGRPGVPWLYLHHGAAVAAAAAEAIGRNDRLSPGERSARADRYAAVAVTLLGRVGEALSADERRDYQGKLGKNEDFRLLRDRPDFRRLTEAAALHDAGQPADPPSAGRQ